jgi:hypothetical protein
MKKILLWLLLAAVLALPAPAEEMTTTVLMYVAGDDLESVDGIAMEDFAELIYTDIAEEGPIRVLALTGGCEYWWYEWIPTDYPTVHSFDSHAMWPVNEWEPANMGDPETLRQFISYGLDFDPSDRTILVLWGHGDGPVGGVCSDGLYDMCSDQEILKILTAPGSPEEKARNLVSMANSAGGHDNITCLLAMFTQPGRR